MKNVFALLTVVSLVVLAAVTFNTVQAPALGGIGTINQLSQWSFDGVNITQNVADAPIKFTGLESDGDCITTDTSGILNTATCGSGGSGLATTSIDTEAKLEAILTDVTDVFTNNDGALNDDDVSEADVTAHEAALTITESQISDLDHYTTTDFNNDFTGRSTTNLSEGTNLYYTEGRVTANTSVTANTAKVGITTGQASAIVTNTAKVTNATHSGEVAGSGVLTIANNIIEGVNLEVSNIEVEDDIFTFNAATGGFVAESPSELCIRITGGAGLCDGTDDSGAGGIADGDKGDITVSGSGLDYR